MTPEMLVVRGASEKRLNRRRFSEASLITTIRTLLPGDGMFGIGPSLLVLLSLGGLLALFGVGTFLFQAGCALADVPERSYFRALPIYSVAVVICLPLAAVLVWFAGRYDTDPNDWFSNLRILTLIASLPLIWFLSAIMYSLLLAASIRKGMLIAAIELVLMALLTVLVSGVVLVILAVMQITTQPPPKLSRDADPSAVYVSRETVNSRRNEARNP